MLTFAGHLFGCLVWGALIALILTAICVFIAKGVNNRGANIAVALLLFIPLCYQSVLGVGSLYARGYVDSVREYVVTVADAVQPGESLTGIADEIGEQYPQIPEKFLGKIGEISEGAASVSQVANDVADSLKSSLTSYLWQRIAWAIGFMAVGTFLLIKVPGSSGRRGSSRGHHRVPTRNKYDMDF